MELTLYILSVPLLVSICINFWAFRRLRKQRRFYEKANLEFRRQSREEYIERLTEECQRSYNEGAMNVLDLLGVPQVDGTE